jgi:ATP-dependent helicase HrpB
LTPLLPIHALRSDFDAALAAGPVVLSSPTGSGKSTEVPRWCPGRVLVIEPRRIACRSLAVRVAELEGSELGDSVGYLVRDEQVAKATTRIVFATPGMALRNRELLNSADSIILDEFHERNLDTDLLLALLLRQSRAHLVVMSATLEGERVANHVAGRHLTATGKAFEVSVKYLSSGTEVMPHAGDLSTRVQRALDAAQNDPGDVLVFLPGKAEIEACAQGLRGRFSVVPLHGSLSLSQQRRAFETTRERKVVLATNVAETSLTIPGIGVVIDSGLVRQTRYHDGRSYLVRGPIAQDSATQRTGRAGRTGPGVCYRLWSASAQLQPVTLPEIQRESLVPLLLTAAAWGQSVESLPLLDAPKPYALEAARAQLQAWGALQGTAELSDTGRDLFALPVAPAHARLLVEARKHECLDDMIDLVAVLTVGRSIFDMNARELAPDDDLRAAGCDASAAIAALRAPEPARHGALPHVVQEARAARERLRRVSGLPQQAPSPGAVRREALLTAALAADPQLCHVSRGRGRERYFSNGGTELALARDSAANKLQKLEAVLALETRAFGAGREAQLLITCAMPLPMALLARAGLGEDRLGNVRVERSRVIAQIERVYAQRVIAEREEIPKGPLARQAIVCLLLRGSLFREAVALTTERLGRATLAAALAKRGHALGVASSEPTPTLEAWLEQRILTLGVESGEDLPLLSAADVTAPELPFEVRSGLDEQFPLQVSVGDAVYRAQYDLTQNQVLLQMVKGSRTDPPPLAYLPKFTGLRICVAGPRGTRVLRERGSQRG